MSGRRRLRVSSLALTPHITRHLCTRHVLLTTRPLAAYHSPLTTHHSPLTTHNSQLTTHQLTTHHSPLTNSPTHQLVSHHSSLINVWHANMRLSSRRRSIGRDLNPTPHLNPNPGSMRFSSRRGCGGRSRAAPARWGAVAARRGGGFCGWATSLGARRPPTGARS